MLLGPVSLLDCLVFCLLLAPQVLIHAGIWQTLRVVIQVLPFLLVQLPCQLIDERYWRDATAQTGFVRRHTLFEDLVIRCVRYAFVHIPACVGRVFFSKAVALPFLRWRMLRHGRWRWPVYWVESTVNQAGGAKTKGVWIRRRPESDPDHVVYYVHGGGFAMGSCYFWLEFLLAWHHLLVEEAGYENPAVFALDYALAPDAMYPTQVEEVMAGYEHALAVAKDSSRLCVAGDSAGATLVLSLLLKLGSQRGKRQGGDRPGADCKGSSQGGMPRVAVLISPWVTLETSSHYPSHVDYLDRRVLRFYGQQYAGPSMMHAQPASPGNCSDTALWHAASPQRGYLVTYGDEEVLAPDIEWFVERQREARVEVCALKRNDEIHAWPVASLFLSNTEERRLEGLRSIVGDVRRRSGGTGKGKATRTREGVRCSD